MLVLVRVVPPEVVVPLEVVVVRLEVEETPDGVEVAQRS